MTAIMESAQKCTDRSRELAKKIYEDFSYKVEKAINQPKPPFWSFTNLLSIGTWGDNPIKEYVSPFVTLAPSPLPVISSDQGIDWTISLFQRVCSSWKGLSRALTTLEVSFIMTTIVGVTKLRRVNWGNLQWSR